jgi:membrane-associated phospholipid phosphatase
MKTSKTTRDVADRDDGSDRSSADRDPGGDILRATPGGLSERIGRRYRSRRPIVVGSVLWLIGYVIVGAVVVGLGLLLTHVLLAGPLGRWDESASRWFVARRTPTFDSLTSLGSTLGSTFVIVGVAVLAVVILAIGRHWRQIGLIVYGSLLEFAVFLTATLLVDRARPDVLRLDPSPVTSSYPSGHAAAAFVLFVGLAIVITSLVRSRLIRVASWLVALAIPTAVALSRLYRGMHHLTDVAASLILGVMVVLFALLTIRTVTTMSTMREAGTELAVTDRDPARKRETVP